MRADFLDAAQLVKGDQVVEGTEDSLHCPVARRSGLPSERHLGQQSLDRIGAAGWHPSGLSEKSCNCVTDPASDIRKTVPHRAVPPGSARGLRGPLPDQSMSSSPARTVSVRIGIGRRVDRRPPVLAAAAIRPRQRTLLVHIAKNDVWAAAIAKGASRPKVAAVRQVICILAMRPPQRARAGSVRAVRHDIGAWCDDVRLGAAVVGRTARGEGGHAI